MNETILQITLVIFLIRIILGSNEYLKQKWNGLIKTMIISLENTKGRLETMSEDLSQTTEKTESDTFKKDLIEKAEKEGKEICAFCKWFKEDPDTPYSDADGECCIYPKSISKEKTDFCKKFEKMDVNLST